ncbi:hypothetical protein [Vibrio crassostreae]|uniref:hypothetical protein n=1 Tax=Vibrio crassostreae TaxID=246167 RepID=UPI001B316979|nr:hypothetical protein [Vibrio crassostreae]
MQDTIIEKPQLEALEFSSDNLPANMSFVGMGDMPDGVAGLIKPINTRVAYELVYNEDLDLDTQSFTKAYLYALCLLLEPFKKTPVYIEKHLRAEVKDSVERKAFNDAIKAMYPNGTPIKHVAAIARVCRLPDMEVFTRLKRLKLIK